MTQEKSVTTILQRAEETLYTASLGLVHIKGADARARIAGLRNVVVFGRAVTNVLQNLRSVDSTFDGWYQPHVEAMRQDPLMRFFYQLRSEILKQGALSVSSSMTINGNPMAVFQHFKPPPRAKGFFIGDSIGGSGWEVETEEGAVEKFYVQLPESLPGLNIDMNIHLPDAPIQFRGVPVPVLCEEYLAKLSALVQEAKARTPNAAYPLRQGDKLRQAAICPLRRTITHYSMAITIRPETPVDEDAIEQVTRWAFLSHPYSQQTEQFIIRALRADHALSLSLVAEDAGRIVGHIAFSPVSISDGVAGWYGLGPISVDPALQRRGIGRALMERGLAELRKTGANGCVLVGDPAFYIRFGFANNPALVLEGVPQEFFLSRSLGTSSAQGNVQFHPAFQAKS